MNYWLMKSEPSVFSIDDLVKARNQTEQWDGVRNYQARNYMRDQMKLGDQVFFYHSNCSQPGIVGIAEIVRESYADFTAFNPDSDYYDPKSTPENPRWFMVDIKFVSKFPRLISLDELKQCRSLADMPLVRKGNRLSVMPVTSKEWRVIIGLVN